MRQMCYNRLGTLMKKHTLKIIAAIILVCIVIGITTAIHNKSIKPKREEIFYAKTAQVASINVTRQYVSFIDARGSEWYWYCDATASPWAIDESVLLVMKDNGTDYAYDDSIVSITREGIVMDVVS